MKTELWNGHPIRFVEKDGKSKIKLSDFLNILEELSSGAYMDLASTFSSHKIAGELFGTYLLDDGRWLTITFWTEIEDIEADQPFPVLVDVEKCYGVAGGFMWWSQAIPRTISNEKINGYVYVLKAEGMGLYKIGCTGNIEQRRKQLSCMSPVPLSLIQIIETPNMYQYESFLHSIFECKRHHGEWFKLNSDDLEKIKILAQDSDEVYKLAEGRQVAAS